jgi:phage virion morphogenesis protein
VTLIEFHTQGFETATLRVSRLAAFEPDQLLTVLGNLLRSQTLRHFEEEAGPTGKWASLRPSTSARKRGGQGQILTDKGQLRGSVSAVIGASEVEVGTNLFYGKFHQYGTRKMVARPFLGLTNGDRDEVERTVDAFMTSLIA